MLELVLSLSGLAAAQSLVVDGGAVELSGEQVFETVEVINGGHLQVTPYNGDADSGWLHLKARTVLVEAGAQIAADVSGSSPQAGSRGDGEGGGGSGSFAGGAGHGGDGARGFYGCYDPQGSGGATYGSPDAVEIELGSAGGSTSSELGGRGGGAIWIDAGTLEIAGSVSADAGNGGASGGGSGGTILLMIDELVLTGDLSASGGDADSADYNGAGGPGGGGRIKIFYGAQDIAGGAISVEHGAGGCGDANPGNGTLYSERWGGDRDGDGYTIVDGDCDDWDAARNPDASEDLSDGVDNDCDGDTDESAGGADEDGDGYSEDSGDCDDADPDLHPGQEEACDGLDNDCDGDIDEGCDTGALDTSADDTAGPGGGDDSAAPGGGDSGVGDGDEKGGICGVAAPGPFGALPGLLALGLALGRRREG